MVPSHTPKLLTPAGLLLAVLWAAGVVRADSHLVFPHVVDGEGIRMEIQFTNPGDQPEAGRLFFLDSSGEPAEFWLGGELRSGLDVAVPPGGVWSIRSDSRGDLTVGYAVFVPEQAPSNLEGLLIFAVGQSSELSVPASRGGRQGHFLVEGSPSVRSGIAIANDNDSELPVWMALLNEDGSVFAAETLRLGPAHKKASFLDEIFEQLKGVDFKGSLHVRADRPFHLLGLRQQSNGSLAGLAGGSSAYPNAASQLLFLVDSGVDPREANVPADALKDVSVRELTGRSKPLRSPVVRLRNDHPEDAVTLQIRLLNDRCEDILRFLMVLKCGEEVAFQPLDFDIPGSQVNSSQVLFGDADSAQVAPISAHDFGDGRFLVEVQAVGASLAGADVADVLFPNELAPIGACNVTPLNSGATSQPADNLWVCNARPMSFDYLTGSIERTVKSDETDQVCRGPMIRATRRMEWASFFLAALEEDAEGCLKPGAQRSCRLRRLLSAVPAAECAGEGIGVVIAVRSSDPTYTLRQ